MKEHSRVFAPVARCLGIDVEDRWCEVHAYGAADTERQTVRVRTSTVELQRFFDNQPPIRVVLEAGTHALWIARLASQCGHEVIVANPRRLALISQSDSKSDQTDSRTLGETGAVLPHLLAPVAVRPAEVHEDLLVIRARACVVRTRTTTWNSVRGLAKGLGRRLPRRVALDDIERYDAALRPLLELIRAFNAAIKIYDERIAGLAEKYPAIRRLQQITGVGPVIATTFVLTLFDPHRFRRSRQVGAYLGLRPRQRDSGASSPQLAITKAGDRYLRSLLVQGAHYILGRLGPDSDLRRWGLAMAERGGKRAKKRAVVAVARKLAVLLHRLWVSSEPYEPLHARAGR